jgi:hypothetical protein
VHYSFTLLNPDHDLMLLVVGHRPGYSLIFWKHGKFAGAERHASPEAFLESLDTILEDPSNEIDWALDKEWTAATTRTS